MSYLGKPHSQVPVQNSVCLWKTGLQTVFDHLCQLIKAVLALSMEGNVFLNSGLSVTEKMDQCLLRTSKKSLSVKGILIVTCGTVL